MRVQSINNHYQNKSKNTQSFGMVRLPEGNIDTYEGIFGVMCGANIEIGRKTITRNGKLLVKDIFLVNTKNGTIGESNVIRVAKTHLQIKPKVINDDKAQKMIDTYKSENGYKFGMPPLNLEKMGFDDPL